MCWQGALVSQRGACSETDSSIWLLRFPAAQMPLSALPFSNPVGAANSYILFLHVRFHQNPFTSFSFFLTLLISKVPILHSNIHQPISFQKQDVANLNLSAFWELSVNTTCKPGTIRAVPTSCQQSDIETGKRRVTPAPGWRLGNLICLLLSRKEATVGYPCLCAWTWKRAFCAAVRNRVPGMHGACLSVCLHMINHSTWNPFTMVESGQWTT